MALESTRPLQEMSTRKISWRVKAAGVRKVANLTVFMCRLSLNLGASNSWKPQGLSRPVMGIALPFVGSRKGSTEVSITDEEIDH